MTKDEQKTLTEPTKTDAPKDPPEFSKEPIVLAFKPRFEGEFLYAVPARDLTQADVDRLDPWALANATAPGPDGTPLYHPVDKK
jgi:hypothetical protein